MTKRKLSAVEQWAEDRGIKLREEVVALDRIHPNPWNPNKMDEATKVATRESIAMFGFIDQPHVREHPELDGHYQLLDGEHRVAEARVLEYDTIPVTVLDVDTPTAMKLTLVLNQRGHNDDVALGAVLGELQKQGEGWNSALAFDDATLKHLIELGANWTPPEPGAGGLGVGGGGGSGDDTVWETIVARVPGEVRAVWENAKARAVEAGEYAGHDDEAIANGQFLEVLAASYLAGPDKPPDDDGPDD